MDKKILKKIIVLLIVLSFILVGGVSIFAQTDKEQEMAELKKELEELEKLEIELLRDSTKTEAEIEALRYRISTIIKNINQLNTEIRQAQSKAQVLTGEIKDREASIEITLGEIDSLRGKLTENLRLLYEEDQKSIIEILISEKDLSGFFNNSLNLEKLSMENRNLLGEIITLKVNLEEEKTSLGVAKNETEQLAQLRAAQAREAEAIRKAQELLLKDTQAERVIQEQELEEIRKRKAEIEAKLFPLIGVPIGKTPEFGELLEIAKSVSNISGIRPALLLGVISQESALGRNVGQCYITNSQTGEGVFMGSGARYINPSGQPYTSGGSIKRIARVDRDLSIFLRITGNNFSQYPVSCWIPICYLVNSSQLTLTYSNIFIDSTGNIVCPAGYAPFGFGGAVGPAQFLPSTWQSFESRITARFGISNPNPWEPRDALAASSLYLAELGATSKTYQAEFNAAHRYSGGYAGYANGVMQRASCVQSFIDTDTMSQNCQNLLGLRLR